MNILNCPICGAIPAMSTYSLDRGNGHGYPGNFGFRIECSKCGLVPYAAETDIYEPMDKAINKAIKEWNSKVNKIEKYLKHRDIKK